MLTCTISADCLNAWVEGEYDGALDTPSTLAHLDELLSYSGVHVGIILRARSQIAALCTEKRSVPRTLIALGIPPRKACWQKPSYAVPAYNRALFSEDALMADGSMLFGQLCSIVNDPRLISPGELILRFNEFIEAVPGLAVTNVELPAPVGVIIRPLSGSRCQLNETDGTITSLDYGVVLFDTEEVMVAHVNANGAFSLDVAPDCLSATVTVVPAGPGGQPVAANVVLSYLESQGIVFGVDPALVKENILSLAEKPGTITVAQAHAPVAGEDGKIEYLINVNFSTKPVIRDDGRADYYAVHTFESVLAGQTIVRISPPRAGKPGVDIYRRIVLAPCGNACALRIGSNLTCTKTQPVEVKSLVNGHLVVHEKSIEVVEVLRIKGDIDYHSGNIEYIGDVDVSGDVKTGFSVKTAGSIRIWGTVEDAQLEARGNIVVHGGFIGVGKGSLWAGGDAVVGFVRNQTIMAGKNIMISGESVDARLSAGRGIYAEWQKSWIVGGSAVARNLVRAGNIGNEMGKVTLVQAGLDILVKRKIERHTEEKKALTKELESTQKVYARLGGSSLATVDNKQGMARAKASVMVTDLEKKIADVSAKIADLTLVLYNRDAFIEVINTVYEGVTLSIARNSRHFSEPVHASIVSIQSKTLAVTAR